MISVTSTRQCAVLLLAEGDNGIGDMCEQYQAGCSPGVVTSDAPRDLLNPSFSRSPCLLENPVGTAWMRQAAQPIGRELCLPPQFKVTLDLYTGKDPLCMLLHLA